jgi:integrase
MANRDGHRRFGSIRKLPSGRWQARYPGPDGRTRTAPRTFARKEEAARYLTLIEAQLIRGEWIDPDRGRVQLRVYAEAWIRERPGLRPRTVELYDLLLRRHIAPYLGDTEVGSLTTPMVRDWRAKLIAGGASEVMAAKAYRLLRAILNTAVDEDEMIRRNPCRIPGADKENSAERPALTVAQVLKLADLMPARFRALVIVSTFACLRWGEAIALQRQDVNLTTRVIRVTKSYSELRGSVLTVGPTKSRAGVRSVTYPAFLDPFLSAHLRTFTLDAPDALIFTGARRGVLRRSTFRTQARWQEAARAIGVPGLHFHDLRHAGNTLAASTGTSLADLMARMGHDSPRAAMIYQHATADADRAIAAALDALAAAELTPEQTPTGRTEAHPTPRV